MHRFATELAFDLLDESQTPGDDCFRPRINGASILELLEPVPALDDWNGALAIERLEPMELAFSLCESVRFTTKKLALSL
jgi:hypothetical protein